MDKRTKSAKNFFFLAVNEAIAIAFGLILPRMFIISYGSEVNGLLNSLSQFLVCLNLFEAGIGGVTLQALYKPVAEDDWDAISGVMASSSRYYKRAGLFYLTGLLALTGIYPLVVDSSLPFGTVAGAVFFSGAGNVVLFYFQAKYQYLLQADGKGYIFTNLTAISTVLTSLSKIVLIRRGANIVLILAAAFVLQCLQIAYVLWYVRSYDKLRPDAPPNNQALAQKDSVLVHQISSLVFRNTDVMILTVFCGLQTVSVYTVYKMVSSHLESLLRIPVSSVNFVMGQTFQTDRALYVRRSDLLESYYSALLFSLFSVALFLYLPFVRVYTAGADISYADPWLAVLFVLIALLNNSRGISDNTGSYAGHFRQTVPFTIIESAINLTTSLIGVCFLGIYGVLLGTVAALAYRTNQTILYANHKVLNRGAGRTYAIYGVNILLFFLVQFLFRRLLGGTALDSYPRLIAAGFASTLLALAVFFGGQTLLFPHCRQMVRDVLRHRKA